MKVLYIIAGVPRVGKSTLIKEFIKRNKKFLHVEFLEEIRKLVSKKYEIKNQGEVDKKIISDDKLFLESRKKVVNNISKLNGRILFETGLTMKRFGLSPTLSFEEIEKLGPKHIFVVENTPSEWNSNSVEKYANNKIEDLMSVEKNRAELVARTFRIPLTVVVNKQNKTSESLSELSKVIM